VYIPRIQREDAFFAAKDLGARGALLSALARFFERGCWGSVVGMGDEGQRLTAEDQLFILTQAALYFMQGFAAPEARVCHERAESLCHSLNNPLLLHSAPMGQWRHSLLTEKAAVAMQIAKRIESLAQEQKDAALMLGASRALACTHSYLGDFNTARQTAIRGLH